MQSLTLETLPESVGKTLNDPDCQQQFTDVYATDDRLRSGSFGTVYTCYALTTPELKFAVKILDRKRLKKTDDDHVFREVAILKQLTKVDHVVRLLDFFVTPSHLYLVQVYAAGGDVFDRLADRKTYTEKDARDLARVLLSVMDALHRRPLPIVHRDLKPENLLLKDPADNTSILLADFGFARTIDPAGKGCNTRCGTPAFCAPEIVLGLPYRTSVDLWSTGCLLYMLVGGYPPFSGDNHRALFRKVRAGDFVFHQKFFGKVSIAAKRLISDLLTVRVDKRPTAEEALQADWFQKPAADLLEHDLSISLLELQKFSPRRTWRSAGKAIRWASSATFWKTDKISFNRQMADWDLKSPTLFDSVGNPPPPTEGPAAVSAPATALMNRTMLVKFKEAYELKQKLRSGSYATVWECRHVQTNEKYAVKIIERKGLQPKDDEAVLNEVAIMQCLSDNKYVVHLMDFYEEDDRFYIVMEYMSGGDVFDRIVAMTSYTEKDARDLALVLFKAVASLHKAGVAHRDLKPQNLLLKDKHDHAAIKIGDFGFARRVHTPQSLTTRVGTPSYVAPEVLKNIPHDERVDLWSIGVILFVLLVGYPPFLEDDQSKLFQKIRNCDWSFDKEDWRHISSDAKDLIRGLLVANPKERWTMSEALRCRWINQDPARLSSVNLTESVRVLKAKQNRLRTLAQGLMWVGKDSKPMEVITQAQDTASAVIEKLLPSSANSSRSKGFL